MSIGTARFSFVGLAVCRELFEHRPKRVQIHSLRQEESEEARRDLLSEAGDTRLTVSWGDIFGLPSSIMPHRPIGKGARPRTINRVTMTAFLLTKSASSLRMVAKSM